MRKIILLVSLIFLVSCAKNVPVLNEKSDIEETFLVKEYSFLNLIDLKNRSFLLAIFVSRAICSMENHSKFRPQGKKSLRCPLLSTMPAWWPHLV